MVCFVSRVKTATAEFWHHHFGLGRISQQSGSTTEYFLGDALGSVRQLTDNAGEVTYAKAYDPYGVVTQVSGEGQSAIAYTYDPLYRLTAADYPSGDSYQYAYDSVYKSGSSIISEKGAKYGAWHYW